MTTPVLDPDSREYQHAFARRAAMQRQRHNADPLHQPKYLPADEPGLESDYTFGSPEEDDS